MWNHIAFLCITISLIKRIFETRVTESDKAEHATTVSSQNKGLSDEAVYIECEPRARVDHSIQTQMVEC